MIRELPEQTPRVETGPTQFGDDWPGIFIRGDNAFYYAAALESALHDVQSPITKAVLTGLLQDLESSRV